MATCLSLDFDIATINTLVKHNDPLDTEDTMVIRRPCAQLVVGFGSPNILGPLQIVTSLVSLQPSCLQVPCHAPLPCLHLTSAVIQCYCATTIGSDSYKNWVAVSNICQKLHCDFHPMETSVILNYTVISSKDIKIGCTCNNQREKKLWSNW